MGSDRASVCLLDVGQPLVAASLRRVVTRLKELGANEYDPITKRGQIGFVTASVVDPFGNVLGIMYNPHYVAVQAARADRAA